MKTNKKSTFIKLDRSILTWRWYQDSNTFRLFLHLLLTANIKPSGIGEITIGRGEVAVSYKSVANTLRLSIQEVRTAFRHLRATREITITRYSKFSVVSILNFDLYQAKQHTLQQSSEQSPNTQITNEQHHLKNIRMKELKELYIGLGVTGDELITAYAEFETMRTDLKKRPLTEHGRKRLIDKVNRLSNNNTERSVELLNNATDNCWLSVWSRSAAEGTPSERADVYQDYIDSIIANNEEE